jgi:ABC-type proline/glycine betaine transport system ATPase subunit
MREGRVIQRGSAEDLVRRPADEYVKAFVRAQRVPGVAEPA